MKTKKIFSCLCFGIIVLAFVVALGNSDFMMKVHAAGLFTASGNNAYSSSGNNTYVPGGNVVHPISGNNTYTASGNNTYTASGNNSQTTSGNNTQTTSGNNTQTTSGNNTQTTSGNNTQTTSGNNTQTTSGNNTVTEKISLLGDPYAGSFVEMDVDQMERIIESDDELMEYYLELGETIIWYAGQDSIPASQVSGGKVKLDASMVGKKVYAKILIGKYVLSTEEVTVREARKPADVDAVSTNLDGKVGLLFYVTLPDYVLADDGAYATLTLSTKDGDVTETQLVKNAPYSPRGNLDRRQFSYYVVSKQMQDKVTLNLYLSNGTKVSLTRKGEPVPETGYAFSVAEYCELASTSSSDAKMAKLAKRLKAYNEMAMIYFNYRADGLVPDAEFNADLSEDLANYAEVISGECPAGLVSSKPQGVVLILEEETTLRVNWKFETGEDPYSYEYWIDEKLAKLQHVGSDYFLAVENISSKQLGDAHKFTISKGGKSYTWTGSALTWANSAVNKGGANARNMGKALYLYNQAAREYFNY